jgi:hypothetical protein
VPAAVVPVRRQAVVGVSQRVNARGRIIFYLYSPRVEKKPPR